MKKILAFLFITFLFVGCNKDSQEVLEKEDFHYYSINVIGSDDVDLDFTAISINDGIDPVTKQPNMIGESFEDLSGNSWKSKEYKVSKDALFSCSVSATSKNETATLKIQLLSKGKVIKEENVKSLLTVGDYIFIGGIEN